MPTNQANVPVETRIGEATVKLPDAAVTCVVPDGVPSEVHKLEKALTKNARPLATTGVGALVRPLGKSEEGPGATSASSVALPGVPSVDHSSVPCAASVSQYSTRAANAVN